MPKVRVDETLEMGYDLYDFTDPWSKPDTIVLQTGCLKPRDSYYAWIPTLARHFRVIRAHLRGHYDSTPAPKGYRWTMDGLVLDHKNFFDALGLDKVHYVGESLGGMLGYHLAYQHPERLRTVTIVNAPGPSFKHHRMLEQGRYREIIREKGVNGAVDIHAAARIEEAGKRHRALVEWYNAEVRKSPLEGSIGYLDAAWGTDVNAEEFLPQIRVPVLLLMGAEHTRILTLKEAERFRDLMPRAKLVAFPGVKAMCQFTHPEKCAREVLRFIREEVANRSRLA